jgi:hypothetical protein
VEGSWQIALALAASLSMSSTAIVIKLVAERLELESEHGKRVVGVLLFQDLAVVPLLVLIPALAADPEAPAAGARARRCSRRGTAHLLLSAGRHHALVADPGRTTEERRAVHAQPAADHIEPGLADRARRALSLALGAFIAGMLISETEYKHQVETDIRPFHDVLLGLFFISIGMLLDWRLVLERWPLVVLLMLTSRWLFKLVLMAPADPRAWRTRWGVSLRVGFYLAQAGEFGFVLLTLAQASTRWSRRQLLNPILAGMVLSMLATPFIIQYSNRIVMKLVASDWLLQARADDPIASQVDQRRPARDHLRLRPLRPEPGAHARGRRHPVHGARSGPGPGPAGRRGRAFGGVWRRRASAGAEGRRPAPRQRRGRDLCRYRERPEGAAPHPRARGQSAGGGAHASSDRGPRKAARGRCHRGGAGSDRSQPDAGQPRAGADGRAHAPRRSASCRTSAMRVTSCCGVTSTAPTTTAPTISNRSVSAPSPCR